MSTAHLHRKEGQALLLGCLMMLVLCLGVLWTLNLGHSIHERIRLQNSADAAAYSLAAMEARAFNFYAYANHAQASHYVSATIWQSSLSFMTFTEAFLVDSHALFLTFTDCGDPLRAALCATADTFAP